MTDEPSNRDTVSTRESRSASESLESTSTDDGLTPTLEAGEMLAGRYRVMWELGTGATGRVYEVFDESLEERIALKILHPELSSRRSYRRRLRDEVRLARRVSHPNVCRVHDLGVHEKALFVTMELVDGDTLRRLLSRKHPNSVRGAPLPERVDLIVQVCSGLSAAHAVGVLHRDVKPDNIMVESDRAVLTDFGIAKRVSDESTGRNLVGTPGYIAPEVLIGGQTLDRRIDVYSVAVMTYELVASRRPFLIRGLEDAIKLARIGREPPPLPFDAAPRRIVSALDRVIAGGLAPDPDKRIRSVDKFASLLVQATRGDDVSLVHSPWQRRSQHVVSPTNEGEAVELDQGLPTPLSHSTRVSGSYRSVSTVSSRLRVATVVYFEVREPGDLDFDDMGTILTLDVPLDSAAIGGFVDEESLDTVESGDVPSITKLGTQVEAREATLNLAAVDATGLAGTLLAPDEDSEAISSSAELPLQLQLERIIVDAGGTPLLVTPVGLTAVFGVPLSLGDDAARAARAALQLVQLAGVDSRAAVDTGRVLYRIGHDGLPTASGGAMDKAKALAKRAAAGQVWASRTAARHLAGRFQTTDVFDEGASDERVLQVLDESTASPEHAAYRAPLVGRSSELAAISDLVRGGWQSHNPAFATLIGEAGLGKSRLRIEIQRQMSARRDIDWLVGRAAPQNRAAPLSLLHNAHSSWAKAANYSSPANRAAAFAAARRWLEMRAARRPVGVFFEDIQWADEASMAFLAELRVSLEQTPVAIICTARPELHDRFPEWRNDHTALGHHGLWIDLKPLGERHVLRLVEELLPGLDSEPARKLAERAAGNPFFIEELARDLRERNETVVDHRNLPETVEAVVQARIDRLPPLQRHILVAAAVVGRQFWREAAQYALDMPHVVTSREVDAALEHLERRGMILPLPPAELDDDRYAFKHALLRDAAYKQLAPKDRRRLHHEVATWLQRRAQEQEHASDHTLIATIAHHLDLSGRAEKACLAFQAAGEQALRFHAPQEAATCLKRALALSAAPTPSLLERLGDAIEHFENVEASTQRYQQALDLLLQRPNPDPLVAARLARKLGQGSLRNGDNADAIRWYEQGLAYIDAANDHPDRTRIERSALLGALGWVLGYLMGDNERGLPYSQRAVALLENTRHKRELAQAFSRLGANFMRAGRWQEQLRCNERNLEIGMDLRDRALECIARINLGVVQTSLGNLDIALGHTQRALALARSTGALSTSALARSNLALLLLELGRIDESARELDEAIRLGEKLGSRTFLPESYLVQARIRHARGDIPAALEAAHHSLEIATQAGSTLDQGITQRVLGALLAESNDIRDALRAFSRSIEFLHDADPFEEAKTRAATARVLVQRNSPGDTDRADFLRDAAKRVFERLGAAHELTLLSLPNIVR